MPTYISMLNWSGSPEPHIGEVRRAIEERSPFLRMRGLHSVTFLPDEGACAGVMVSTCRDEDAVARLAGEIYPRASVRTESMVFDDGGRAPAWLRHRPTHARRRRASRSLVDAIAAA